jgi:hypothetical protein
MSDKQIQESEEPGEYRVMFLAKNTSSTLFSRISTQSEAYLEAARLEDEGHTVHAVITQEHYLERTGPSFVRYLFAGEQRDTDIEDTYADARHLADEIEEQDEANADIQILPAKLHPSRYPRVSDSLLPQEPTEEQYDALTTALKDEAISASPRICRGDRVQALEWALRLVEVKRGGVMSKDTKATDVVEDASVFLVFLDGTTEEQ